MLLYLEQLHDSTSVCRVVDCFWRTKLQKPAMNWQDFAFRFLDLDKHCLKCPNLPEDSISFTACFQSITRC